MEIRNVKPNEIDQAIELADETFREEGHSSMGEAFPHVFSKGINHSFGAFDGDKLVSFMGLVPSKVKIGPAELTVFSIGAVCTHVDYRKRGISSAILQEVYQYIDQAGGSLLLISGDRGLYTRNHCYHFGETYQYTIRRSKIEENSYQGLTRKATTPDVFQVDELRKEQSVRFGSSLWEWSTLFDASGYTSIYKMKQTLFVAENQGVVEGYVVIGLPHEKSSKQEAVVTELGGQSKAVHHILVDLLERGLTAEINMTIPWHEEYHQAFHTYPVEKLKHGGTVYLVNGERLIEQVKPYISEKDPTLASKLSINQTGNDEFQLTCDQSDLLLTRRELVEVLFNVQSELRTNELNSLFPIPFPNTEGMHYV